MLSEKKPYVNREELAKVTDDEKIQEQFLSKFSSFYSCWKSATPDSDATLGMASIIRKLKENDVFMAVLLNDVEYIKQHAGDNDDTLNELLDLAFAAGAKASAEYLMTQLDIAYDSNKDYEVIMLEYIASSGDFTWLKEVLTTLGRNRVPNECFREIPYSRRAELKALHHSLLPIAELVDVVLSEHPELDQMDNETQTIFLGELAKKIGVSAEQLISQLQNSLTK